MQLKQTIPGSHAELILLIFNFIFHPIYLFFHMRPRYSHFNQIAACYLYSCPNLIPGKVMEHDCETDEKSLSTATMFLANLLQSKMSHLKLFKVPCQPM